LVLRADIASRPPTTSAIINGTGVSRQLCAGPRSTRTGFEPARTLSSRERRVWLRNRALDRTSHAQRKRLTTTLTNPRALCATMSSPFSPRHPHRISSTSTSPNTHTKISPVIHGTMTNLPAPLPNPSTDRILALRPCRARQYSGYQRHSAQQAVSSLGICNDAACIVGSSGGLVHCCEHSCLLA
jgi:hypothetical protein